MLIFKQRIQVLLASRTHGPVSARTYRGRDSYNNVMKTVYKLLFILGGYLGVSIAAGIAVAEGSLHLRRLPLRHAQAFSRLAHEKYGAALQNVAIKAGDGVVLKGWYIQPKAFNRSAVVLMHGITDNREGVAGYGEIFLDHGYSVLLPDARAHGESEGQVATYGIKEAGDLHGWVSWLYTHKLRASQCVYGFGESYGAALILQSLAVESRYCAVAVEDSFATARDMSYQRVSALLHLGPWFAKTLGLPVLDSALVYARLRYGVDLLQPSPLYGVEHSKVPALLIQGTEDRTISPHQGEILAHAEPDHVRLWLVHGAGHTMAWTVAHQEFERRILDWFAEHHHEAAGPQSAALSTASH